MVRYDKFMKWVVRGLLGLVILVSLSGVLYPMHGDEGVFATVGRELSRGKKLYGDIWDNKPPGIYLVWYLVTAIKYQVSVLNAWMSKVWLMRLLVMVVNWLSAGLIYLIYIKYKKSKSKNTNKISNINNKGNVNSEYCSIIRNEGLICALSYLIFLQAYQGQFGLTEPFMVLGLLIAVWLLVNIKYQISKIKNTNQKYKNWLLILLAGGCMGMALLFKQSAIVNLVLSILYIVYRIKNPLRSLMMLISGVALVWLPVLVWLASQGIMIDFWQAVVVYPLIEYPPLWRDSILALPQMLVPAGILWAGVICLIVSKKITNYNQLRRERIWLWLMLLVPLPLVLSRPYHHYWLQILPLGILVLMLYLERMRWVKVFWIINLLVIALISIRFVWFEAYAQQQAQIEEARLINECGDFSNRTWVYFLTDCSPKEREFFKIY